MLLDETVLKIQFQTHSQAEELDKFLICNAKPRKIMQSKNTFYNLFKKVHHWLPKHIDKVNEKWNIELENVHNWLINRLFIWKNELSSVKNCHF